MKYITQYWPVLLILLAFLGGRYSSPDHSEEVEKQYKKERNLILEAIAQKQLEVAALDKRMETIEAERVQDSLRFAGALEVNQRAYTALKKKYNEINLNRATHAQLDSVVSVLY